MQQDSSAEQRWYFPDGTWHPSVAYRHPAMHLDDGAGCAKCNRGIILNTEEHGYSAGEAAPRACRRCLAAAEREKRAARLQPQRPA